MGGELYSCPDCGEFVYRYHSCRNRACPKCHTEQTKTWLEARHEELIDSAYFHVVITVPSELRRLIRSHQRELYDVLLRAAYEALQDLAWDRKYLGGELAAVCVLHTWTRTLEYHPHVHLLVPGVGLDRKGKLRRARQSFFVPHRALAKRFAGKFLAQAKVALPAGTVVPRARKKWVAFVKATVDGGRVLDYLARYVFRQAITNRRILSMDNGRVRFRYQDSRTHKWKALELDAGEFIRRFLQHVLPARLHKIRYSGLWHPRRRSQLQALKALAAAEHSQTKPTNTSEKPRAKEPAPRFKCPRCGCDRLAFLGRLRRSHTSCIFETRAPPRLRNDAA
jgi:predicted RNA-binding Zn-ribbon protein involved in translation (DUF1610 family)